MDTTNSAAVAEPEPIDVNMLNELSLGEHHDPQDGHINPEIQSVGMTRTTAEDLSKREGDRQRRTRHHKLLRHIHISPIMRYQSLTDCINLHVPSQVLASPFGRR